MKLLALIYLSSALFLIGAVQLPFENQYGSRELLFSPEKPNRFDEVAISPFEIILKTSFSSLPTIVYCISGYEGTPQNILGYSISSFTQINIQVAEKSRSKIRFLAEVQGDLSRLRVNFFAFDRESAQEFGFYTWGGLFEKNKVPINKIRSRLTIIERLLRRQ